MKEICFSVLLAVSDILVASFALFWHNKTFGKCVIEALYLQSSVDTKLYFSGLVKNMIPTQSHWREDH